MLDDSKLAQRRLEVDNEPVSQVLVSERVRFMTSPDLTAQRLRALRLIEAGMGDSWLVLQTDRYEAGIPTTKLHMLVRTEDYEPMNGAGMTRERADKLMETYLELKPGEVGYVMTPVALIAKVAE